MSRRSRVFTYCEFCAGKLYSGEKCDCCMGPSPQAVAPASEDDLEEEAAYLYGVPGGSAPQGVIYARPSPVLLDADQVKNLVANARRELITRCIDSAWRWAVLRGGQEARLAAQDIARELRAELAKEGA